MRICRRRATGYRQETDTQCDWARALQEPVRRSLGLGIGVVVGGVIGVLVVRRWRVISCDLRRAARHNLALLGANVQRQHHGLEPSAALGQASPARHIVTDDSAAQELPPGPARSVRLDLAERCRMKRRQSRHQAKTGRYRNWEEVDRPKPKPAKKSWPKSTRRTNTQTGPTLGGGSISASPIRALKRRHRE
jgi:hypothetical protein